VVEKVVNKTEAKTQYSKELLEFKWKSLNEKTRSILKEVLLYHAESADGTIASCFKVIIKNPMYDFSKLSTFWKTIYSNLAYRREYLVDYGYLKKRYDEGKVDSFYLTPLGEEVVKRLRSGVLQIPDVRTFAPKD
jgi:hypothetical protein